MRGVGRRGHVTAAAAVMGAAAIAAFLATPSDRPVDIRLVAPPPASPEVVTATATTTVPAIGAVKPQQTATPPPPETPVQAETPAHRRPDPRAQEPHPPGPPGVPGMQKPPTLGDLLRCDAKFLGDDQLDRCLELPRGAARLCDLLPGPLLPGGPPRPGEDEPEPRGRPSELDCDRG